jgi:hypothetical protein
MRYGSTVMSLSPDEGFLIETGTDARSTIARIDLDGSGVLNNGAIEWSSDGSGSLGYNGVKWKSNGSGSLAKGMISWDSSGTFHIGSDDKSNDFYTYGFDLTDNYLRIGGSFAYGYNQDFIVDMSSSNPSVTISTPGSGYHGAGGNTTTFNNSGMQTTGFVDCDGLSITSYSTDHKSHASLDRKGLTVANDIDNLSSPYTQVTNESVKTTKVVVGADDCYLSYITPYTNTCVTHISSKNGIQLSGGPVTVGDYGTTTYYGVNASSFNQQSDERLKTKISDISLTAEQISEAPAIAYHWNSDETKTRQVGTIAQYWQNVLPEVVSEDPNGYLGLAYSELSAISVISLAKEIVELKKRIKELENK